MSDPRDPSEKPARPGAVVRDATGRLMKGGANLNPGGRPKGVRAKALEYAGKDGERILQFFHDVVTGKIKASVAQRIDAAKEIMVRAVGKAPDIALSGELGEEAVKALSDLEDENVADLLDALRRKAG
jgi:hypothetical protein